MTLRKETQHQFYDNENCCGFPSFIFLKELSNPNRGFLVDDMCIIEADVAVFVYYFGNYSKKKTGYVGLVNQAANSDMSSLFQTLYHIPCFRKVVYNMPTTENDVPTESIPLALQILF